MRQYSVTTPKRESIVGAAQDRREPPMLRGTQKR